MTFTPGPGWRDGLDPDAAWMPSASRDALRLRAWVNRLVREFFHARNVLEVETPAMSLAGNTDPNIASFSLEFSGRTDGGPRARWLRTSPEFALKRLLAAGVGDCYELGRVFRNGEAGGRHNPEFDAGVVSRRLGSSSADRRDRGARACGAVVAGARRGTACRPLSRSLP